MFFFFKQKTAYEMRISDWSSDVCSSDLALACLPGCGQGQDVEQSGFFPLRRRYRGLEIHRMPVARMHGMFVRSVLMKPGPRRTTAVRAGATGAPRSHGSFVRTALQACPPTEQHLVSDAVPANWSDS